MSDIPTLPDGAACAHLGCTATPTFALVDFDGGWLLYFCRPHLVGHCQS